MGSDKSTSVKEAILTIVVVISSMIVGSLALIGVLADGINASLSLPIGIIAWGALVIMAYKGANP